MSGPYSLEDFIGYWPTVAVILSAIILFLAMICGGTYGVWLLFKFLVKLAVAS